jgi:hypothetical protein
LLSFDVIERLAVARPRGIVDARVAEEIVEFVELKEVELEQGFNRCCDLTSIDGITLSISDVFLLANRRRAFNPNNFKVRSAFLATNPLAVGMARMYEQLLNSPRIEVRVWADLEDAAEWLGVDPERLRP